MIASLEPVTLVLRLHRDAGLGYPYEGAATVSISDGAAELRGLTMAGGTGFTVEHFRAVREVLKAAGCTAMWWDRRAATGTSRRIRVKL